MRVSCIYTTNAFVSLHIDDFTFMRMSRNVSRVLFNARTMEARQRPAATSRAALLRNELAGHLEWIFAVEFVAPFFASVPKVSRLTEILYQTCDCSSQHNNQYNNTYKRPCHNDERYDLFGSLYYNVCRRLSRTKSDLHLPLCSQAVATDNGGDYLWLSQADSL